MGTPDDEQRSAWEQLRASGTTTAHAWVTRDGQVIDTPEQLRAHLATMDGEHR
jgi:hypothetical protein